MSLVLVIERPEETLIEKGITKLVLDEQKARFLERSEAELVDVGMEEPQLLVYMMITYKNLVLTYYRKTGAEKRLHGLKSLGFGGHVSNKDAPGKITDILAKGARRELLEELNMDLPLDLFKQALEGEVPVIVDNTNDVGKVHLGVFMQIELPSEPKIKPEDEISLPKWEDKELVVLDMGNYEGWSQLVIGAYL